jgi:hypothetical protein
MKRLDKEKFYKGFKSITVPLKTTAPTIDVDGPLEQLIGRRCKIMGKHPWRGYTGEIVRVEKTPFGKRPVVRLDDGPKVPPGQECFVMKPEEFGPL